MTNRTMQNSKEGEKEAKIMTSSKNDSVVALVRVSSSNIVLPVVEENGIKQSITNMTGSTADQDETIVFAASSSTDDDLSRNGTSAIADGAPYVPSPLMINEEKDVQSSDIETNVICLVHDDDDEKKFDLSFDSDGTPETIPATIENASCASPDAKKPFEPVPGVPIIKRRRILLYVLLFLAILVVIIVECTVKRNRRHNHNAQQQNTASSSSINTNATDYNVSTTSTKAPIAPTPIRKPPAKSPVAKPYPLQTTTPSINELQQSIDLLTRLDEIYPVLINAGSKIATVDTNTSEVWMKDQFYNSGDAIQVRDCPLLSSEDILDRITCSYRLFDAQRSHATYTIALPRAAMYDVTLHFLEPTFNNTGRRVFDVIAENQVMIPKLDIYQKAGGRSILYSPTFTISVTDGKLSIDFGFIANVPVISGIEVRAHIPDSSTSTVSINGEIYTNITAAAQSNYIVYQPGNVSTIENGIRLSFGLTARALAQTDLPVKYHDGSESAELFHKNPDAGATFPDSNPNNPGGWIYVSNSEVLKDERKRTILGQGGVGAITFDKDGNVLKYERILINSTANCGGGKTPWGTWISAEEYSLGNIWQVDPTGNRTAEKIFMGLVNPGKFESFSYDTRNQSDVHFFATKDDTRGEITRFTPINPDWNDPWSILINPGIVEYLIVEPTSNQSGTYRWTTNLTEAKANAQKYYPNTEGTDRHGSRLYFVTKKYKGIYIVDLDGDTYTIQSTQHGLFAGEPDQIVHITDTDDSLLYFTEDGGHFAGVHARDRSGEFYTILEGTGAYTDEATGLSFSPDAKHLYIQYQDEGVLLDVTRLDGLPFDGKTVELKYHSYKSA